MHERVRAPPLARRGECVAHVHFFNTLSSAGVVMERDSSSFTRSRIAMADMVAGDGTTRYVPAAMGDGALQRHSFRG